MQKIYTLLILNLLATIFSGSYINMDSQKDAHGRKLVWEENFDGDTFDRKFYLLIDMQLGGTWVDEVKPDDLHVDWMRFYSNSE